MKSTRCAPYTYIHLNIYTREHRPARCAPCTYLYIRMYTLIYSTYQVRAMYISIYTYVHIHIYTRAQGVRYVYIYRIQSTCQRAAKDISLKLESQFCTTNPEIPPRKAEFPISTQNWRVGWSVGCKY